MIRKLPLLVFGAIFVIFGILLILATIRHRKKSEIVWVDRPFKIHMMKGEEVTKATKGGVQAGWFLIFLGLFFGVLFFLPD